jgi:hypothetical protein
MSDIKLVHWWWRCPPGGSWVTIHGHAVNIYAWPATPPKTLSAVTCFACLLDKQRWDLKFGAGDYQFDWMCAEG